MSTRKVPQVINAEEFAKVAADMSTTITIHLYLNVDINKSSSELGLGECFKNVKPMPGITKIHCLDLAEGGILQCHLYSSQPTPHNEINLSSDSVIYNYISSGGGSDPETTDDDGSVSDDDSSEDSGSDDDCTDGSNDDNEKKADSYQESSSGDGNGSNSDILIVLGLPSQIKDYRNTPI